MFYVDMCKRESVVRVGRRDAPDVDIDVVSLDL